ncbi:MAG: hypothetical protein AAF658_00285 [Myxococcota bacterium]
MAESIWIPELDAGREPRTGLADYDTLIPPSLAAAGRILDLFPRNPRAALIRVQEIPHTRVAAALIVELNTQCPGDSRTWLLERALRLRVDRPHEREAKCAALHRVLQTVSSAPPEAYRVLLHLAADRPAQLRGLIAAHPCPEPVRALVNALARRYLQSLAVQDGVVRRDLPLVAMAACPEPRGVPPGASALQWFDENLVTPLERAFQTVDSVLRRAVRQRDRSVLRRLREEEVSTEIILDGHRVRFDLLDPVDRDRVRDVEDGLDLPDAGDALQRMLEQRHRATKARRQQLEDVVDGPESLPEPPDLTFTNQAAPTVPRAFDAWFRNRSASALREAASHSKLPRYFLDAPAVHTKDAMNLLLDDPSLARQVLGGWAKATRLVFAPGGGCHSTFADFAVAVARAFPVSFAPRPTLVGPSSDRALKLPDGSPSAVHGRTLVFDEGSGALAFKVQRKGESRATLEWESRWLASLDDTQSLLPESVSVQRAPLTPSLVQAIEASGVSPEVHPECLVYRVSDRSYWDYANTLEEARRQTGLERAAADLFSLLRRGVVDRALTVKNHSRGADGTRRYAWMIDTVTPPWNRQGMGRLDAFEEICRFPNVRATGLADYAELVFFDALDPLAPLRAGHTLPASLDPWARLHHHAPSVQTTLRLMHHAGDMLLDLTLLTSAARLREHRLHEHRRFGEELRCVWTTALQHYSEWPYDDVRDWLGATIDFQRMARQLDYFVNPKCYAPEFDRAFFGDDSPERLAERLRASLFDSELALELGIDRRSFARDADDIRGFSHDKQRHVLGPHN